MSLAHPRAGHPPSGKQQCVHQPQMHLAAGHAADAGFSPSSSPRPPRTRGTPRRSRSGRSGRTRSNATLHTCRG
eukprot:gene20909-biopygen7085